MLFNFSGPAQTPECSKITHRFLGGAAKVIYLYLGAGFGVIAAVFAINGGRIQKPARGRMLSIAAGFGLLCVSAGVVPRILIGRPSSNTIAWVIIINQGLILLSAPLLFLGFTPPAGLLQRSRR